MELAISELCKGEKNSYNTVEFSEHVTSPPALFLVLGGEFCEGILFLTKNIERQTEVFCIFLSCFRSNFLKVFLSSSLARPEVFSL